MEPDEGALFLLHRAKLLDPDAPLKTAPTIEQNIAHEIVKVMDGLPLALDQAGAYIEETACGLRGYWQLYQKQGAQLLQERGALVTDHPDPVATTWALSFQNVEQANPAAAELLRFCAFLAPDAIPEELFSESAAELGPLLEPVASDLSSLNAAIRELLKYSLVHRDPEAGTLSIHRLVQEVHKNQMEEETQRLWAERAVRAVNQAFPEVIYENWLQCQGYISQVLTCNALIKQWEMTFPEAAQLLDDAGYYFYKRAKFEDAERLLQYALVIRKEHLGPEHPNTATSMDRLGKLYYHLGEDEKAERMYQRALAIREQQLGPKHPDIAKSLHHLAGLYTKQGKYGQAEGLYQQALVIYEQQLDPFHPATAGCLDELANLYNKQGKHEQAEPLLLRALAIHEKHQGDHPYTAWSMENLAEVYFAQGNYEQAESLMQRAYTIRERQLGPDHPETLGSVWWLAFIYSKQGMYEQAEPLYLRVLNIYEKTLPPDHLSIAGILENYAYLLRNMNRVDEAEPLEKRARAIRAKRSS